MGPKELNKFAPLSKECRKLLTVACDRLALSARGFDRVRRVARTLADLEGEKELMPQHVAEALQYRHEERSI
jgi:magnesium chelatase family protein